MLILALESSAKSASCAVLDDGKLLGQTFQNNGLTHSRTLLSMAEFLLKNLDLSPADVNLIAVASGPGSFTGIRIGVSAAKGLAWGLDLPVCGVSTLEAMAYQTGSMSNSAIVKQSTASAGTLISPVMDARRNQVYNALFECQSGKIVRLCEDRAVSLSDLTDELSGNNREVLLVGDGAHLGLPGRLAPELIRFQTAYGVALCAASSGRSVPAIELEPHYLRAPQAERVRGCNTGPDCCNTNPR